MAAPDFTLIRGGQINQAGDDRALFLKVFGGEVFAAYEEANVFSNMVYNRTLENGKSAQFPSIGGKVASYHTPGKMIVGTPGNLAETVITVDDFVESSSSIAEIDQAMAHFDYRQPFSREDGRAIARHEDKHIAALIVNAGMETTSRFDGTGDVYEAKTVGKIIDKADSDTDVAELKAALTEMAVNFDEKDIPEMGRNFAVKPLQYHLLATDKDTISSELGGIGDQSRNVLDKQLHTFNLVKSNNVPTTQITDETFTKYNVDARNLVGMAWIENAVGVLRIRNLSVGMTGNDYLVTHNATLVSSKMLKGGGVLRPECAGIVRTAAPS